MRCQTEDCIPFLRPDLGADARERVLRTLDAVIGTGKSAYADEVSARLNIKSRRVLEVGCHYCWYAPFLLAKGADFYCGVDIELDLSYTGIHGGDRVEFAPIGIGEFIDSFVNCTLILGDVRDLPVTKPPFDAAFMISTSEHFDDPRASFFSLARQLAPNSEIFINHHNYYGWNGHHRAPWTIDQIDDRNSEHLKVVDWRHVVEFVQNIDTPNFLNYLRPHKLLEIVEEFFEIEEKNAILYEPSTGAGRLTSEILTQLPRYYREELETISLLIKAKRRSQMLWLDDIAEHIHRYQIELTWCEPRNGYSYLARLPSLGRLGELELVENEKLLQPAYATPAEVSEKGGGTWTIVGSSYLLFSSSDNSNPNNNGRRYILRTKGINP
jgi:SAM-dependent methyltransferase